MDGQKEGRGESQLVAVAHHQIALIVVADSDFERLQCQTGCMAMLVPDFKHDVNTLMLMLPQSAILDAVTTVKSDKVGKNQEDGRKRKPGARPGFLE